MSEHSLKKIKDIPLYCGVESSKGHVSWHVGTVRDILSRDEDAHENWGLDNLTSKFNTIFIITVKRNERKKRGDK